MMRKPIVDLLRHTEHLLLTTHAPMSYYTHKNFSGTDHALAQPIHIPRIPTCKLILQCT